MSRQIRSFNVIVRPVEEGGYWTEVLELPGCVSQAETLEELHKNTLEAIQACLAAMEEDSSDGLDADDMPKPEIWRIPVPV